MSEGSDGSLQDDTLALEDSVLRAASALDDETYKSLEPRLPYLEASGVQKYWQLHWAIGAALTEQHRWIARKTGAASVEKKSFDYESKLEWIEEDDPTRRTLRVTF